MRSCRDPGYRTTPSESHQCEVACAANAGVSCETPTTTEPRFRQNIIDTVGNGDAGGIGAEVVIVHQTGGQFPACAGIAKVADQFPFFGVHADDGQAVALERLAQIGEVEKLLVAMRAEVGGKLLVI